LNDRFTTFQEELVMRRYELVSGTIFAIVSLVQLTRIVLGWPVQIDLFTVPVWLSGVAFLVAGGLAIWAFRSAGGGAATI
jgi:hypothetical protein